MSDLVRRLRNREPNGVVDHGWSLCQEAADTIADLEAENALMRRLVELAFEEGFQRAASMTEHVHMVIEKQPEAWKGSKARAALEGE